MKENRELFARPMREPHQKQKPPNKKKNRNANSHLPGATDTTTAMAGNRKEIAKQTGNKAEPKKMAGYRKRPKTTAE